jgi:hypothetical protein
MVRPAFALIPVLLAASAAPAGIAFREVEVAGPGGAARVSRQVRQVFAEGDDCKIILEESTDPLAPAGAFILVTANDAFIVDPVRATVTPVAPTTMQPVEQPSDREPAGIRVSDVTLELQFDEAGPQMLGLPTRHYIYRLRYEEHGSTADGPGATVLRREERHEFWATPWPGELPATWRAWRVAEDAGAAAERREVREVIDAMHGHGLMLRQLIERRDASAAPVETAASERVSREVTAFAREEIAAEVFQRPSGFSQSEFLAPLADDMAPPERPVSMDPAPEQAPVGKD